MTYYKWLRQFIMAGRRRRRGRKRPGKTEAVTMTFKSTLKLPEKLPRGTHVKMDGLDITVERRGTSSRIALGCLSLPQLHVRSAKDHTGEETALQGVGPRGWTLKTIRTEGSQGVPTQAPVLITPEEPQVLITVEGPSVNFFWTLGQLFLCSLKPLAHFPPDPLL